MAGAGSRLKEIREKLEISQSDLAERAQIPIRTLQDIEYEITKQPSFENIAKLAVAMGVTLDALADSHPLRPLTPISARSIAEYVSGLERHISSLIEQLQHRERYIDAIEDLGNLDEEIIAKAHKKADSSKGIIRRGGKGGE